MKFMYENHVLELGQQDYDGSFKMENDTSYLEKFVKMYKNKKAYREFLLPAKLTCLTNLRKRMGEYDSYYEPLAGFGMATNLFLAEKLILNDHAEDCVKVLRENFPTATITQEDLFKLPPINADVTFLDFNNHTVKRGLTLYKPSIDQAFANSNKYVIINDCSKFYLKYGANSYKVYGDALGKDVGNTLESFYEAMREYYKEQYPDWSMWAIESFKDTSFILFIKDDQPFEGIHEVKKQDIRMITGIV